MIVAHHAIRVKFLKINIVCAKKFVASNRIFEGIFNVRDDNSFGNFHCGFFKFMFKAEKEVIVDLACGMAVLRGADVFKQGIVGAPLCE